MNQNAGIVGHYGGEGLLASIEAGLAALGKTAKTASVDDLAPVDEFHVGGRAATSELCNQLDMRAADTVLDIGCGIGGTSRFLASTSQCHVTGIDLNPNYVEVAKTITAWTSLSDRTRFEACSALELPFAADSFDRAVQLHVGMNIEDKAALFAEIARVLRPGGRLGVYDIVRRADGELSYPMPWATDDSHSFVSDAGVYQAAMEAAGFAVSVRDRWQFARDFFSAQAARTTKSTGQPPLGLHLIIGTDAGQKLGHLRDAVTNGVLAPVEFICSL